MSQFIRQAVLLWFLCASIASAQTLTTIYQFGANSPAPFPNTPFALSGTNLYGASYAGGQSGGGYVYAIGTNGVMTILHQFHGGGYTGLVTNNLGTNIWFTNAPDGFLPNCNPILIGSNLYGTTIAGGSNAMGTVYVVDTNGISFTTLHHFSASVGDGAFPYGGLVNVVTNLYGTAHAGSSNGSGCIYSLSTNGTSFIVLHAFAGVSNFLTLTNADGAYPATGLTVNSNSTMFGVCPTGGTNAGGTLFSITTNGTFTLLHHFNAFWGDGAYPAYPPTLFSNIVFGTTPMGGTNGGSNAMGTAYYCQTNGAGYAIIHAFFATKTNGATPMTGLVARTNGVLFGLTVADGTNGLGTFYQMATNGTGFLVDYSFTTGNSNAAGALTLSASNFYGQSIFGGTSNSGTIFQLNGW